MDSSKFVGVLPKPLRHYDRQNRKGPAAIFAQRGTENETESVPFMDDLTHNVTKSIATGQTPGNRKWLARIGMASFIFFFVKGLVWLALGAGAWVMMRND